MPDKLFSDPDLAALYDLFSPSEGREDFGFYLPLIMSAKSVLDVGCGTGALLHLARSKGHRGRLCGVDPARSMIEQARRRTVDPAIEWILGDVASVSVEETFDLIVMSGHAFQVFVEDDALRNALAAIRSVLATNGRFAFETRNPPDRAWKRWNLEYSKEVNHETGVSFRSECNVEIPVEGDVVRFSHTVTSPNWQHPKVSHSTLRFLSASSLEVFLNEAGLEVDQQFGDWDRTPLSDASREIITIARRVGS